MFDFAAVMSIVSNSSEGEAVLESPWYNRSAQGYGRCLQFRFLMFGPGAEMLEIHQEISAMRRRIWKDSNNKIPYWRYGQVAFSSVARSKVRTETRHGNINRAIDRRILKHANNKYCHGKVYFCSVTRSMVYW